MLTTAATYRHNRFLKILALCILLLNAVYPKAQNNNFVAAEILYNKGDYYSALNYYMAFLANAKSTKTINKFTGYLSKQTGNKAPIKNSIANNRLAAMLHLASSYRLLRDYENAVTWYDSVMLQKDWEVYTDIDYWQGVSLRAVGNTTSAKIFLTKYVSLPVDKCLFLKEAKKELADIDFATNELALKKRRKSVVTKLPTPINSNESNYAGTLVGNNLFFSSTRSDGNQVFNNTNLYQHHLYKTSITNISDLNKIALEQPSESEQGAASFTADGKTAYFTQWENVMGKKLGSIYKSNVTDTVWAKPTKLDTLVNKPGHTSQQPFITADGKYLFFASDRVGGKGKFDIWCVELDKNASVKKLVNLPANINTSENEKSPFYHTLTHTLVFASDGLVGMGGYDLFSSKQSNAIFEKAINLGSPINTNKDDMYFFAKENASNIVDDLLLSSDRDSKCCLELFNIRRLPTPINTIIGTVRNMETQAPVTELTFNWLGNNEITTVTVNAKGGYKVIVPDTANYTVKLSNVNYADTNVAISHIFYMLEDSVLQQDFYLRPLPPVLATATKEYTIYFDFDKSTFNDTSKLLLDSLSKLLQAHSDWKLRIDGFTDAKGDDAYNLMLSKKRVEACFNYLKSSIIDNDRLITSFFGEMLPIASNTNENGNDNPTGRQLNRRVFLSFIIL